MNRNSIIRLSHYRNALYRLKALGFVKVFSENLGNAVNVTSVQVRKDFSMFGITGNRRGGYQVDVLLERLDDILGKHRIQKVVLAGVGMIGRALLKYRGFEREGIRITAGFDIDPANITDRTDPPIYHLNTLKTFIREHDVKIAILAVPDIAAQQVADMMCDAGIKGIMNFAPIALRGMEGITVNNVNLAHELENVIYFVNAAAGRKEAV